MFAFFLKILFCLLVAAAIGFVMAWLLRGLALNRLREHNYRLTSDLTARDNQVAAAQTQIQDLRGKNALFERDLGTSNSRIAELQDKIALEQKHNLNLADELRMEHERLVAMESLASKRTTELEAAQKSWAHTAKDKDSEISRLGAQLTPLLALPVTLTQKDDALKSLQSKLDETSAVKGTLEAELSALRATVDQNNRTAADELRRSSERAAELEGLLAVDRSRLSELEALVVQRVDELDAAQSQLQSARNEWAALSQTKDSEIARLGSQLSPLAALPAALSARDAELARVKQAHESVLAELQKKLETAQQQNRTRDADFAAARAQLESEIAALRGRSDGEASQLKSRVSTLVGDLQSRDSTVSTLRVELDAARKTLESRSALLRDAEAARQSAGDLVKVKDAELARLRAELSTLNVLPARVSALQAEIATAEAVRRDLQAELAALRKTGEVPPRQFLSAPTSIDDLKHIFGVGPVLEKMLNDLGVYQFKQVALWNEGDIEFFDKQLHDFHGRIQRENWIRSAQEEHYKKSGEWLGPGTPSITMPETNR